jgi:hypothetical protein
MLQIHMGCSTKALYVGEAEADRERRLKATLAALEREAPAEGQWCAEGEAGEFLAD